MQAASVFQGGAQLVGDNVYIRNSANNGEVYNFDIIEFQQSVAAEANPPFNSKLK